MLRVSLALLVSLTLSACEGGNLPTLVYSLEASEDDDHGRYPKAQPFNLDTDRLPGSTITFTDAGKSTLTLASGETVTLTATTNTGLLAIDLARASKFFRNELQNELIMRSDAMCGLFKDRMYQINSTTDFALLGSALAFTSAATIVVGDRAKDILAGLGGTSAGLAGAKDSAFLMNQLISTIFQQIDKSRTALLEQLLEDQVKSATSYTATRAISDAVRYHELCNLPPALAGLSKSIEKAFEKGQLIRNAEAIVATQGLTNLVQSGLLSEELSDAAMSKIIEDLIPGTTIQDPAPAPAPADLAR